MSKELEMQTYAYWNAMRTVVAPEDYITATVLISEVKKNLNGTKNEAPDEVYSSLLEAADRIGVKNPFGDKERFFLVYREIESLKMLDWEGAIAQVAVANKMPLLPKALVDVLVERFDTNPDNVLIAEAEKFCPNLKSIIDDHASANFVLTTQNVSNAKALKNIFHGYENVEVIQTSIYEYEFLSRRFDLIVASPAFGGRTLVDAQNFMCRELDMVALENLSLHLNDNGRLVIILPGRITFAAGKVGDLRRFIQDNYIIRELAELPEGTIEYCGIKVYLLDIENDRPENDNDIIIRRYSAGERKNRREAITTLDVVDDTFVMLSELIDQGDWSIDRIFAQQDEDYLNFQNSGIRKERIGNVAEVFRGKAVTKKAPAGNIGVINISNIGLYEVDYNGIDHLQEEERKVSNYVLQEGDVLLPARGTAIRTAVFHTQSYPCIASANLIVIRPNPKMLNSTYLKVFLDSPIGNKIISGAQQGMIIMNISYRDLNVLEIPLPAIDKQEAVAKEYLEEYKRYKATISDAEKRWSEVITKLQKF